jgi:beta-lactamase superfamily II metal-dependent hydrolase
MSQLAIYLEIIAAVLAGLDYLVPDKVYKSLDKQLRNLLKYKGSAQAPLDKKSLSLSYLIVLVIVLGFIGWGAYQDINKDTFSTFEIVRASLLLIAGVLLGMAVLVLVTNLLEKLQKSFKITNFVTIGRSQLVWFSAIALMFAGIFSLAPTPQWLDALPVGFAFGAIMLDLMLLVLPLLQKWLTFRNKIMARIAILVFLAAMIIQLTTPTLSSTPSLTPTFAPNPTEATLPQLKVHYIDVDEGDSILLDLGKTEVLIDGGDRSPGIVPYLQQYVDGPIEAMIATHPDSDHIGGLIAVFDAFTVEKIWTNGQTASTQTYADFIGKVNTEGADVQVARLGDTISVGNLTFKVLNPVEPLFSDYNSNSIVLMLSYGNVDFLFMGDAQQDSESSMIAEGQLHDIDILKVGHHGSRTSSSQAFLNIVRPEVTIYMAGIGNQYGHPHPETIAALQAIGAQIYGTDTFGTITVTTDGNSYPVSTAKKGATTTATPTPTPASTSAPTLIPSSNPSTWDWKQILVTVVLTILGSAVIAYSTLVFQDKFTKRRLFKALLVEVCHNVLVVRGQEKRINELGGVYAPAGLKKLHTASYYSLKERGILADVPEELREKIFRVYDTIYSIHEGRFDLNLEKEVISPSSMTPGEKAMSNLLVDLPELQSHLEAFLRPKDRAPL